MQIKDPQEPRSFTEGLEKMKARGPRVTAHLHCQPHLESTQIQAVWAPCDRFSRLGRAISIWTTPSDSKPPKRTQKCSFAFSCLIPLSLARPAILWLRQLFLQWYQDLLLWDSNPDWRSAALLDTNSRSACGDILWLGFRWAAQTLPVSPSNNPVFIWKCVFILPRFSGHETDRWTNTARLLSLTGFFLHSVITTLQIRWSCRCHFGFSFIFSPQSECGCYLFWASP